MQENLVGGVLCVGTINFQINKIKSGGIHLKGRVSFYFLCEINVMLRVRLENATNIQPIPANLLYGEASFYIDKSFELKFILLIH